ncbi:MAG TPA: hypothetical protein VFG38_01490, partial [Pseudomonadales bacterium]|nr:hypothetical protein [Pseudomonadales bacterium]
MTAADSSTEGAVAASLRVEPADDGVCLAFGGDWLVKGSLPTIDDVRRRFTQTPSPRAVRFDTSALGRWD